MSLSTNAINAIKTTFDTLQDELNKGLKLYWDTAAQILDNSSIKVLDAISNYYSLENNFFSSIFLYSYFQASIPSSRRVFYVAANQCLRGMVTGCDNILDDEYKMTLATDLPSSAGKFRSIIDIMVSDRVLFSLLQKQLLLNDLTSDQVLAASSESLRTLTKSGAQEASEEKGVGNIAKPDYILTHIHSLKTGCLFQSPWALPDLLDPPDKTDKNLTQKRKVFKKALFDIGMGCQVLDDMVDLSLDISMNRHNYSASLIQHSNNKEETALLGKILNNQNTLKISGDLLLQFPNNRKKAALKSLDYLKKGTKNLFAPDHHFMVEAAIETILKRIGADRFFFDINYK